MFVESTTAENTRASRPSPTIGAWNAGGLPLYLDGDSDHRTDKGMIGRLAFVRGHHQALVDRYDHERTGTRRRHARSMGSFTEIGP